MKENRCTVHIQTVEGGDYVLRGVSNDEVLMIGVDVTNSGIMRFTDEDDDRWIFNRSHVVSIMITRNKKGKEVVE